VFTSSTLSTKSNASGDAFNAVLAKAIVSDDWVIAKHGARVDGIIVDSDPGGRVKGVASMTVTLRRLTLADGRTIDLDTNTVIQEAKSTRQGRQAHRHRHRCGRGDWRDCGRWNGRRGWRCRRWRLRSGRLAGDSR